MQLGTPAVFPGIGGWATCGERLEGFMTAEVYFSHPSIFQYPIWNVSRRYSSPDLLFIVHLLRPKIQPTVTTMPSQAVQRISIRWLPDAAYEDTDTVALNVGGYFIDLRVVKDSGAIQWSRAGERIVLKEDPRTLCYLPSR